MSHMPSPKALTVLAIIMSVIVVVLSVLQILDVWEEAIDLIVPLMGLSQIINAIAQWKQSRQTARIMLACGILILVISVIVLIL